MVQLSGMVNVKYPHAYEQFMAALSFINFILGSILFFSCVVVTTYYARLILLTLAPIAVLGALVVGYRVGVVRNGHSIHDMRVARNNHLSVRVFVLLIVYSSVSHTIFQTFICDPLDFKDTCLCGD